MITIKIIRSWSVGEKATPSPCSNLCMISVPVSCVWQDLLAHWDLDFLTQHWRSVAQFSFKRRRDIERTNLECHRETTTIRGSQKLAWSDLKRGNNRLQSRARSKDYDVGTSLQSEDELVSESERGRESDANEPEPSGCKCGLTAALTRSANSTTSRTSRGHSEDSDAPRGFWSAFRWRRPSKTSTRKTGRSRKKRLATVVGRTEVLSVSKLVREKPFLFWSRSASL